MQISGSNAIFSSDVKTKTNFEFKKSLSFGTKKLDRDTISFSAKADFTDTKALKLLAEELMGGNSSKKTTYMQNFMDRNKKKGFSRKETANWIRIVKSICNMLKIKPTDLPINKNHTGNLSLDKKNEFFGEILYKTALLYPDKLIRGI